MQTQNPEQITNIFGGPAPPAAVDPPGAVELGKRTPRQRVTPHASGGLRRALGVCLAAAFVATSAMVGARLGSRAPTHAKTPAATAQPPNPRAARIKQPRMTRTRPDHRRAFTQPSKPPPTTSAGSHASTPGPSAPPDQASPRPTQPSIPAGPTGPGEFF
jgi:hypothetical protein